MNIPTMSVFKNGEVIKEIVGAKPKSRLATELREVIPDLA
jgi:thioredoxin-like negative regulator of GroEL